MNKRGATLDNFFVVISFFGLAITLLIANFVWNTLTSTELDAQIWDQTEVGQNIRSEGESTYANFDWVVAFAYIAVHLGAIILAFLLRSHPIIYVASIFLIVILVFIAVPFSNSWEEITNKPDFVGIQADIPKVDYIMQQLPIFETIWGFITAIFLAGFAKSEGFI
jgi:hypothetical protein|tara:strand:- start:2360 stop:2857 length:498 start_codon:yes stop_codon:yes gene_type:complete